MTRPKDMTTIAAPWSIALTTAAGRPEAMVACPGCAAEVKGRNLDDHRRRLHPDASEAGSRRARVVDGRLVMRRRLGLGRRRVALPAPVEVGTLVRRMTEPAFGHTGDIVGPVHDVRSGTYLRVGSGRRAVTVGCSGSTRLRAHWTGWTAGPRRRRAHVTLSPPDFVALQYLLAGAGALHPA